MSADERSRSVVAAGAAVAALEAALAAQPGAGVPSVRGVAAIVVYGDGSAGVAWCGEPSVAPHLSEILQAAATGDRHGVIAQSDPGTGPRNG